MLGRAEKLVKDRKEEEREGDRVGETRHLVGGGHVDVVVGLRMVSRVTLLNKFRGLQLLFFQRIDSFYDQCGCVS